MHKLRRVWVTEYHAQGGARATSLFSLPRFVKDVIFTIPTLGNLGGHAGGGRREAHIHSFRGENRRLALNGFALLGLEANGGRHERRRDERRHGSGLVTLLALGWSVTE